MSAAAPAPLTKTAELRDDAPVTKRGMVVAMQQLSLPVARRIEYVRRARRLTRSGLARRLGCRVVVVVRLERGFHLRRHTVACVAGALGCDEASLYPAGMGVDRWWHQVGERMRLLAGES